MTFFLAVVTWSTAVRAAAAENIYDFRKRLETVHQTDRRDVSLVCAVDEFEIAAGMVVAIPETAGEVLYRAARDFEDYLSLSMKVDAGGVRHDVKSVVASRYVI